MYHITIALSLNIQSFPTFQLFGAKYYFHIVVSIKLPIGNHFVCLFLGNLFWVIHLLFSLSFLAETVISPYKIKMIKILTKIFAAIFTNLNHDWLYNGPGTCLSFFKICHKVRMFLSTSMNTGWIKYTLEEICYQQKLMDRKSQGGLGNTQVLSK